MDYKEKLEEAKKLYETANVDQRYVLESLFPELKESEDEKIRKAIIEIVKKDEERIGTNAHLKKIQWLEKQGEKGAKGNEGEIPNPAWSEEDEERLSDAIFFVREYQIPTRDKRLLYAAKETEDWLRTFKDRVQPQRQWKPTKKQIMALRWVLNHIPYDIHKEEISGLLDQIKDL